jgi:hypothetical protein
MSRRRVVDERSKADDRARYLGTHGEEPFPTAHAGNLITSIQTAHARIIPNAHLNVFPGTGNPECFNFGITKFVTMTEAKQVLIDTFVRPSLGDLSNLQPIILIGHAVENEFQHLQRAFGVDLRTYGTIVKVIDTQVMAQEAGIVGPNGPYIRLSDLLADFNIYISNLRSAGSDAAGTLIAAILIALKNKLYPGVGTRKPPLTDNGQKCRHVVNALQHPDFKSQAPAWSKKVYCTRCDRNIHSRAQCRTHVCCDICKNSGVKKLFNARKTHTASRCLYQYVSYPLPPTDHAMSKAWRILDMMGWYVLGDEGGVGQWVRMITSRRPPG